MRIMLPFGRIMRKWLFPIWHSESCSTKIYNENIGISYKDHVTQKVEVVGGNTGRSYENLPRTANPVWSHASQIRWLSKDCSAWEGIWKIEAGLCEDKKKKRWILADWTGKIEVENVHNSSRKYRNIEKKKIFFSENQGPRSLRSMIVNVWWACHMMMMMV